MSSRKNFIHTKKSGSTRPTAPTTESSSKPKAPTTPEQPTQLTPTEFNATVVNHIVKNVPELEAKDLEPSNARVWKPSVIAKMNCAVFAPESIRRRTSLVLKRNESDFHLLSAQPRSCVLLTEEPVKAGEIVTLCPIDAVRYSDLGVVISLSDDRVRYASAGTSPISEKVMTVDPQMMVSQGMIYYDEFRPLRRIEGGAFLGSYARDWDAENEWWQQLQFFQQEQRLPEHGLEFHDLDFGKFIVPQKGADNADVKDDVKGSSVFVVEETDEDDVVDTPKNADIGKASATAAKAPKQEEKSASNDDEDEEDEEDEMDENEACVYDFAKLFAEIFLPKVNCHKICVLTDKGAELPLIAVIALRDLAKGEQVVCIPTLESQISLLDDDIATEVRSVYRTKEWATIVKSAVDDATAELKAKKAEEEKH